MPVPIIVGSAVFLGAITPALISLSGQSGDPQTLIGTFAQIVFAVPFMIDAALMLEDQIATLLIMTECAIEYLLLFTFLLVICPQVVSIAIDFLRGPRHRRRRFNQRPDSRAIQ